MRLAEIHETKTKYNFADGALLDSTERERNACVSLIEFGILNLERVEHVCGSCNPRMNLQGGECTFC